MIVLSKKITNKQLKKTFYITLKFSKIKRSRKFILVNDKKIYNFTKKKSHCKERRMQESERVRELERIS